jgi:hypothetical protein
MQSVPGDKAQGLLEVFGEFVGDDPEVVSMSGVRAARRNS